MCNQDQAECDRHEDAESDISEFDSWLFQTLLRKVEDAKKSIISHVLWPFAEAIATSAVS